MIAERSEECHPQTPVRHSVTDAMQNHDKEEEESVAPPLRRIPGHMAKAEVGDCEADEGCEEKGM